jgi:hypothetical protein
MRALKRMLVVALVTCAWASLSVASAHATLAWYYYTAPNWVNSGLTYTNTGFYVSDGHALNADATSGGGARSQVWFNNSSYVRVSAMGSCEHQYCTSAYQWSGSYPSGYPAVHHHGLGWNPDYFTAKVYDSR